MKKNLISVLLVIALLAGIMPITALADEVSDEVSYETDGEMANEEAEGVIENETVVGSDDAVMNDDAGDILAEILNELNSSSAQTGDYGTFIDGDHIISDMVNRINNKEIDAHPRLIMTKDKFASLKSHINDGSTTATLLEALRKEADDEYKKDLATYTLKEEYSLLEVSKSIQYRVAYLALAYNIFDDDKYAKRAYQELENACKFADWNPYHFLDTAEMCTAFAYGYDWLYDWMNEEQRALLRKNIIEKGFNQVMVDYKNTHAEKDRTYYWYNAKKMENWQFVCTGGINLAALAIGDESDATEIAGTVLDYGYKRAYYAQRAAYNNTDGSYIEGLGYWDYATYYIGLQSSALMSTTGTDYGLADKERLAKSAEFIHYMSSNVPLSFSFGDDRDSRNTGWPVFLWLGDFLDEPKYTQMRLNNLKETGRDEDGFHYLDVIWIDESKQGAEGVDDPLDWVSVGASNASLRTSWDKSGLVAALHSGENNYDIHGHYDLGSFYVENDGQRFFTDLGNESYTLDNRKHSYRVKAEGHNTLVINSTSDIGQVEGAVCLIEECGTGNEAYAITDLTAAYGTDVAKSVKRGLKMIKDKECVIIQDEISLNSAGDIYWFAHTKGDISIAADGRSAIVTVNEEIKKNGQVVQTIPHYMWVGLLSQGGVFTSMKADHLLEADKVPGEKDNKDYRKLAIHLTNTKDTTITVVCIPLEAGETRPSWIPTVKSLTEWSSQSEPVSIAKIKKQSMSLSDEISISLCAEISDNLAKTDGAKMIFTLRDNEITVPITKAEKIVLDGKELYKFTCPVPATEMYTTISAVFKSGDYVGEVYYCSITDYCEYIIANEDDYAKCVPIAKAILNYGAAAQKYFNYNTDYLANKNLSAQNKKLTTLNADMLENYKYKVTGSNKDYEYVGMSLELQDKIGIKIYFMTKSGIVSEMITLDAGKLGIGKTYTFHGYTFANLSVYSYLQMAISNNTSTLTELSCAIYDYNEAAKAIDKNNYFI